MATPQDPQIQFFDNHVPKLHSGSYKITVEQTLKDGTHAVIKNGQGNPQNLSNTQDFEVKGPEYQIPAADVHAVFPPNNLSGKFEEILPHVVFNKRSLPWEQLFDSTNDKVPWVALLACQIGSGAEALATVTNGTITAINLKTTNSGGIGYQDLPPTVSIIGKKSTGSGATATAVVDPSTGAITSFNIINAGSGYKQADTIVRIGYPSAPGGVVGGANQTGAMNTTAQSVVAPGNDLNDNPILHPSSSILPPAPTNGTLSPISCQAINVAVTAFQDFIPQYDSATNVDEVSMLAHVRQVSLHDKAELGLTDGWCASVMAKRFPVAANQPVNYAVHVVSLLGVKDYLTPGANFGTSAQIQLISLYSWPFTCQPDPGESFTQLMKNLQNTKESTGYSLQLPATDPGAGATTAAQQAYNLVTQGYVPTTYHTRQGEETMALYRSPLSPVLPKKIFEKRVTNIEMTNKGSGYSSGGVPVVTVNGGGLSTEGRNMAATANLETVVQTLTPANGGSGYETAPTVSIAPPSSGGTTAKAYAVISGGSVTELVITDAGSGYSTAPAVTIPAPASGTQATATTTITTRVGSLTITDPGNGYSFPPTITITASPSGNVTDNATARAFIDTPIGSSTAAAIYNKEWGVFDLSYSSIFLNARLLALSSKSFAVNVMQWRKEAHQMVNNLYERLGSADSAMLEVVSSQQLASYLQGDEAVTETVMSRLTGDYAKQLIPKFSQPITPGSLVNSDIPPVTSNDPAYHAVTDLQALMTHGAVQGQLQALSGFDSTTGTFTNDRFKDICEWLANLVLLEGVPFETLVPDERMLPAGSIRFFYLDPNAIEALIDGALSVGTHSSRDTLYNALMRGVIHDAVKTLIHQLRDNLLGQTPSAPPYEDPPITGFLLRSPVVKGWPGLEVKGYSKITTAADHHVGQDAVPLLRMSHLSSDILLCLFDGIPEWVELNEPSEGLTFGVEDGQSIKLRNLTGSAIGATVSSGTTSVDASTDIEPNGKLDLTSLISSLQTNLSGQLNNGALGPADLAVEMVKMPEHMVFRVPQNN